MSFFNTYIPTGSEIGRVKIPERNKSFGEIKAQERRKVLTPEQLMRGEFKGRHKKKGGFKSYSGINNSDYLAGEVKKRIQLLVDLDKD